MNSLSIQKPDRRRMPAWSSLWLAVSFLVGLAAINPARADDPAPSPNPRLTVRGTCPAGALVPGSMVMFSGIVSNSGNVNLTNVLVTNIVTGVTNLLAAGPLTLVPNQVVAFSTTYLLPANYGSCTVSNLLDGSAGIESGGFVFASSFNFCPVATTPAIFVQTMCPASPPMPGASVTFTGSVFNPGSITLTNVVVLNNQPAPNTLVFGPVTLLPGQGATFPFSYVVPANSDCLLTNTLTALGISTCSQIVGAQVTAFCPLAGQARIYLETVCPANPPVPGQPVTISGVVSNSGNLTLQDVRVVNNLPTNNSPVLGPITLVPGQSMAFTTTFNAPTNDCVVNNLMTVRATNACVGTLMATSGLTCQPARPGLRAFPGQTNGQIQTNGFTFLVGGVQGRWVIEYSMNLTSWTPLQTNLFMGMPIQVTDPSATNITHRFYRARCLP